MKRDRVSIDELEKVCQLLFSHLRESGINEIVFDHDYYWDLIPRESFTMEEDPEIVAGQLFDDWENLADMLREPDDVLSVGFRWLASLFRYISFKMPY